MKNPIYMITKHTITAVPVPPAPPEEPKSETAEKVAEPEPVWPKGIKGEEWTGYEGPDDKGEFECENCHYYEADSFSCGQKNMMAKSKRPKLENGRVVVNPEGCCEFVDRIGKKDDDDDDE